MGKTAGNTVGNILRDVKKHLGGNLYQLGVKAMTSSVQDKEQFLSTVKPLLAKRAALENDKASLSIFNRIKDERGRLEFLSSYTPNRAGGRDQTAQRSTQGSTRGSTQSRTQGSNTREVRLKALEVERNLSEAKREHLRDKKLERLTVYQDAQMEKLTNVQSAAITLYKETESIVSLREEKYLKAKDKVRELEVQIPLIRDDIRYYKLNKYQSDLEIAERTLSEKLKELGRAKKDKDHYAPRSKKVLSYLGDLIKLPITLLTPPKEVELTAEQIIKLELERGVR